MYRLKVILPIIMMLFASSCETDSEIKISNHRDVVMTAFLYQDSIAQINVYGTTTYLDSLPYAPLGDVSVSVATTSRELIIRDIVDGNIATQFASLGIVQGDSVIICADGEFGHVEARTFMLAPVEIVRIETGKAAYANESVVSVNVYFDDPPETSDYYQIVMQKKTNGKVRNIGCIYTDYVFFSAYQAILGSQREPTSGIFTDRSFDGYTKGVSLCIREADLADADEVDVLLYHHTEDYYNFMLSSSAVQNYLLLPVFGTGTIKSNVKGGHGLVSCMAVTRKAINFENE